MYVIQLPKTAPYIIVSKPNAHGCIFQEVMFLKFSFVKPILLKNYIGFVITVLRPV